MRLEGKVFAGRDGRFTVDRRGFDLLRGKSDALALWVTLVEVHGHRKAIRFPLSHEAMKRAGITDLSRDRFRAAVSVMKEKGLLIVAQHPIREIAPRLFCLSKVRS